MRFSVWNCFLVIKVEIILKEREVAFLSPSNMLSTYNFSTGHPKNSNVDSLLLGDKNATSLSFNIISTLLHFKTFPYDTIWNICRLETPKSNRHFISARLVFHKKRVNWMFPFPLHKSSESKQRKKNWRLGARNRRKTFWCWGEMKCEVYLGLCFSVKTV